MSCICLLVKSMRHEARKKNAKGRENLEAIRSQAPKEEASLASSQEGVLRACGIRLGAGPTGKNKRDLVDKVRNVVDHVEEGLVHGAKEVAEQVAKRVDGPAHCDDHAHVVEGRSNSLTAAGNRATSFTSKDFKEDESPASKATSEGRPCREHRDLTPVAACEHHDGAEQELPEHGRAGVLASRPEDQVELNHLQRDSDAPVHIAVDDRGFVNLHPVFTHVHVVHTCHQSDQGTHVQGCLPVGKDSCCLREEEECRRNHCDRDDPERDGNTVIWLQESITW